MSVKEYVGWRRASSALGVVNSTLFNYRQRGCPCLEDEHGMVTYYRYNLEDMRVWIAEQRLAYEAHRGKK